MAKILKLNPILGDVAPSRTDYNTPVRRDPLTPDEARRIMRGIEYDYHTALVGDFAAIRPLIEQLGTIAERKQIYDLQGNNRGPGVILSVFQTMKLVNLMEEEGEVRSEKWQRGSGGEGAWMVSWAATEWQHTEQRSEE